jgi:transposase
VAAPKKYPDELRARAVRLYRESESKPVIRKLAEQLGVHHEALRNWIRQYQADAGERSDRPTTEMAEENRRLRQEVTELRACSTASSGKPAASRALASAPDNGGGRPCAQPGRNPVQGPGRDAPVRSTAAIRPER